MTVMELDRKEKMYSVSMAPDAFISLDELKKNTEEYNRRHSNKNMGKSSVDAGDVRKVKELVRKRKFETVIATLFVVLVGFLAILILYPKMQLSELSRDNSDAKDRIATLQREIIDSEEEINGVTDMDSLRAQALAIGMQDPNSNQVINIPMPHNDKLTTVVAYDANGVSADAYEAAVNNLADYYMGQ